MEAPIAEIKPNIKKAFILNILIIAGIVTFIIVFLIFLDNAVGLDVFFDTFKELGVQLSPSHLLSRLIFLILFFTTLLLILNYVALSKTNYTLYPDKMVYAKSYFIVRITDKTVPYANIAKVICEKNPFLNTSKIILELTGMKEKKVDINFVDDAEEVVRKIQELIREYKAKYYAQYSQDYRYQNIMDRL